jgi:hypothetical protein
VLGLLSARLRGCVQQPLQTSWRIRSADRVARMSRSYTVHSMALETSARCHYCQSPFYGLRGHLHRRFGALIQPLPGALPERIFDSKITLHSAGHMLAQFARAMLTLQLLFFPVEMVWVYAALRRSLKLCLTFGIVLIALLAFTFIGYSRSETIRSWLMPFSRTIISSLGFGNIESNPTQMMLGEPIYISTWISVALSAVSVPCTFITIAYMCITFRNYTFVSKPTLPHASGECDARS